MGGRSSRGGHGRDRARPGLGRPGGRRAADHPGPAEPERRFRRRRFRRAVRTRGRRAAAGGTPGALLRGLPTRLERWLMSTVATADWEAWCCRVRLAVTGPAALD